METFGLEPCAEIGVLKNKIKEAILEGTIQNSEEEAFQYMLDTAKELGLETIAK